MQKVNYTAIIITALIILGAFGALVYVFPSQKRTVQATGTSQMTVPPDKAVVYVQVQTTADKAEDAKNKNSEITNKVLSALESLGVDKADIETENYNIYPEYDYMPSGQKFKDYAATNSIKVSVKDFGNVGKVVDASVNAGATINYINFELSTDKQNQYKKTVLSKAAEDAKSKAEAIATGSGQTLGKLISITTSDYSYVPYPLFRADSGVAVKEAVTNIPSKNLDITATITATYEIR